MATSRRARALAPRPVRRTPRAPDGFDLLATVRSHGWYDLPPFHFDAAAGRLDRVLITRGRAVEVAVTARASQIVVTLTSDAADVDAAVAAVRRVLRLDEDLTPLYALTDGDPRLGYARSRGAGRLLRAPTVFEDVIKMLLTTNCSWAFTHQMVSRLVDSLGEPAPSGRRAFPTAEAMAAQGERFYRDVIRAGYRAPHLQAIATEVARGALDLEALSNAPGDSETVRKQLLALPGIGPYAADNLLRLLGRYEYLGLDSWCRGKLLTLYRRSRDVDRAAARRYRRFGRFMGLAMWLDLTRDWHEKEAPTLRPPAAPRRRS